jgi:hypothetical protein
VVIFRMAMGSNFVGAIFIALVCIGVAFFALGAFFCGIYFWRKKRWLSLAFLIPSILYLIPFFYVFTPRPLTHRILTIDLRRPTDLSGIPVGTKWMADSWPAPKTIFPLNASGSFCCVDGRVDVSIVLPDGHIFRDVSRNVYIYTDDTGIWKVIIDADMLMPKIALEDIERSLKPLAMDPKGEETVDFSDIENRLTNYIPKTPINFGTRLARPAYKLDFSLSTTFLPSDKVAYFCQIEMPHVPYYKRPH